MGRGINKGVHLYININHLNDLVKSEENNRDDLTRVFHWLESFLVSMESFINRYNDDVYIEKLNGSRIHIVIYDNQDIGKNFVEIVGYAFMLVSEMGNTQRYQKINHLNISMGADYGIFNEFEFFYSKTNFSEDTTIGYPANYAAKIQNIANDNEMLITQRVIKLLSGSSVSQFISTSRVTSERLSAARNRYPNLPEFSIVDIRNLNAFNLSKQNKTKFENEIQNYRDRQNNKNNTFDSIDFTESRKQVNFDELSLRQPNKIKAVVIYGDIRGFTKQFREDGSNLSEMTNKTILALNDMYLSVINRNASHVQFQGDRESALRNRYGEFDYVLEGLFVAFDMLDKIRQSSFEIGIGCSIGTVFASRVGMKGRKHNLILGNSVIQADYAEDAIATNNEIAITKEMYDYLCSTENSKYKKIMIKIFIPKGNHYVTSKGLKDWRNEVSIIYQDENASRAKQNDSYKPWSFDE